MLVGILPTPTSSEGKINGLKIKTEQQRIKKITIHQSLHPPEETKCHSQRSALFDHEVSREK